MIRRDDDELIERYQRAWVTHRALAGQARRARHEGLIDYMAEIEAAMNEGQAAAYLWLLGGSPVSPQRQLASSADLDTIRAEFQAATDAVAAGQKRFEAVMAAGTSTDPDNAADYASGVASALAWALTRTGAATY